MGATGPRESESKVQGVDVGVRGSVTGTEVRQAEGWACEGSLAFTVPLSAPQLPQSWPVPSLSRGWATVPPPASPLQQPEQEGVCFLFVGDACKSSG